MPVFQLANTVPVSDVVTLFCELLLHLLLWTWVRIIHGSELYIGIYGIHKHFMMISSIYTCILYLYLHVKTCRERERERMKNKSTNLFLSWKLLFLGRAPFSAWTLLSRQASGDLRTGLADRWRFRFTAGDFTTSAKLKQRPVTV